MSNDWFRSWHGAPTDPKWLGVARKAGVVPGMVAAIAWALMDRASQAKDRGSISGYDADAIGCFFGCDTAQVEAVIAAMHDKGILEADRFRAWHERQPRREDDSGERAKRWRKRKVTQETSVGDDDKITVTPCDAPVTHSERNVTHSERNVTLDTDKDTEKIVVEIANAISCDTPGDLALPDCLKREKPEAQSEVSQAFTAWNAIAADCGLPKAQLLTAERKANLAARLRDCGGIAGWHAALAKIRDAPHLLGENDRGWRADLDFILRKSKFVKLMEGGYAGRTPTHSRPPTISERLAGFAASLEADGESGDRSGGEDAPGIPRLRQGT